jgi:uncharacterized membrane protein
MRYLSKVFLLGLLTLLPIVLTFYVLLWSADLAEVAFGGALRTFLPSRWYHPGMGIALGIAVVLVVGLLMHARPVRGVFDWSEEFLYRVPVVRSIYGAIRDTLQFLVHSRHGEFSEVVSVTLGENGPELIGFVTATNIHDIHGGAAQSTGAWADPRDERVAVYLPLSYQIGGYTVLLPRSAVRPVDMSLEDALRFALTAGVATHHAPSGAAPAGPGSASGRDGVLS